MHAIPGAKTWADGAANAEMGGLGVWVCGFWKREVVVVGEEDEGEGGEGE